MASEHGSTTYLQEFPSTAASFLDTVTQHDTANSLQDFTSAEESTGKSSVESSPRRLPRKPRPDNFLTVASLYGSLLRFNTTDIGQHHVGLSLQHFGAGGFSNAVRVSQSGVAKLPRITPGSEEFSETDFYRDLIAELRICIHPPIRTHENVITLQNIEWMPGPNQSKIDFMWPVLEFETATGTLLQLLRDQTLTFADKMNLCLDVASALDCLHDCGVVHSDVKAENAFIFPHPQRRYIAKIADFGCSTILEDPESLAKLSGFTALWGAPERDQELNYQGLCKTDVYSFGLMVWQVATNGKTPAEWFSWMSDDALLSNDEISALKDNDCVLPLGLEALGEISLRDYERRICSEIFRGTISSSPAMRVASLCRLFEKNWVSSEWGTRRPTHMAVQCEPREFLEQVPEVNVIDFFRSMAVDQRVQAQIFDSIKRTTQLTIGKENESVSPSTFHQLFLCYYHGYGTDRDIEACLSALADGARFGDPYAQSIIAQYHEACGAEIPADLPVCDWLESQMFRQSPGAGSTLKSLDQARYDQALSTMRHTIAMDPVMVPETMGGTKEATPGNSQSPPVRLGSRTRIQNPSTGHSSLSGLWAFGQRDMMDVGTPLLASGADIHDLVEFLDNSALQNAVEHNNIEAVRILLALGAQDTFLATITAASLRCDEILHLLMFNTADKGKVVEIPELSALIYLATTSDHGPSIGLHSFRHSSAVISTFETLDYFIQLWHPNRSAEIDTIKGAIIQEAMRNRRVDILQLVLVPFFIPCIGWFAEQGTSVLTFPLLLGDTAMFSLLLTNGAAKHNNHFRSEVGNGYSMEQVYAKALRSANPFFIDKLLQEGIWLDETRLYFATGGPANQDTGAHFCAFQHAVIASCYDTATFLAGATMQIETTRQPWHLFLTTITAMQEHHGFTMLDYLLQLSVGPTPIPPQGGNTVLHMLAKLWSVEPRSRRGGLRKFWAGLISKFPTLIDTKNDEGHTPLASAVSYHNELMVEALIDSGANLNAFTTLSVFNNSKRTILDLVLFARATQVLITNPKHPPPTASMTKTHNELPVIMLPWADLQMHDTDMSKKFGGINGFERPYQGDAFDKRLSTIYAMIQKAGGTSTVFPQPLFYTESLDNWSTMWVRIKQAGLSRVEGEVQEVIYRMIQIFGQRWRISDANGNTCHVIIGAKDPSRLYASGSLNGLAGGSNGPTVLR